MTQKRKICFVTGTRADYGIMSRLMRAVADDSRAELQIIATNMHLSPEFGLTWREIEADGFSIDRKVEMLLSADTPSATVKSMGLAQIGLADAFSELCPDLVVILGDRYEMLAAASAALIFGIPVAHLHGGEITEGAYDDSIRHAVTKLSYLHFTSTEEYRARVIRMGEEPSRVICSGALGVDNILSEPVMPLSELSESLGFDLGPSFLLVTFHPVTREPGQAGAQMQALLDALSAVCGTHRILFTMPNSDAGGRLISSMVSRWVSEHPGEAIAVKSLGKKRYYSALAHCAAVVGNSSSGLIEAPSFRKPTLNIGNRQKGRTAGNTVVSCPADADSVSAGLARVLSPEFAAFVVAEGYNPYQRPDTLSVICEALVTAPLPSGAVKSFYDAD